MCPVPVRLPTSPLPEDPLMGTVVRDLSSSRGIASWFL